MKYIFIIGTEHHLFQVDIAIKHFNISIDDIILVILEMKNNTFTHKVSILKYGKLVTFKNWTYKDILLNRTAISSFIDFCRYLKAQPTSYILFTSHYDSDPDLLLLSIVNPEKHFLMDEGTASFSVLHKREINENNYFIYLIKSIFYRNFIHLPKAITYFTQYNIKPKLGDFSEKYEIQMARNPLKRIINNEAIFIGTSIVEVNLMKIGKYLSYMKKIIQNIDKSKVYYYPHRKESQQKLASIEALGYIIVQQTEPFEKSFAKFDECPELLCSFFTTGVLDNISKANEIIPELRIYKFDTKLLLNVDYEIYQNIYLDMCFNKRIKFKEIV
jgi:hypothetical protein